MKATLQTFHYGWTDLWTYDITSETQKDDIMADAIKSNHPSSRFRWKDVSND